VVKHIARNMKLEIIANQQAKSAASFTNERSFTN